MVTGRIFGVFTFLETDIQTSGSSRTMAKKAILLGLGALFAVALITASSRPIALETVAGDEEPLNVDAGSLPETGTTVER